MRRKSVLVVEDENSIRESLVELFETDGVEVVAAATLDEAIRHLLGGTVDLVVTDLRLGTRRDGGLQVAAAAGLLTPDALVAVLTAYPDEANRVAARRLGAAYFLEKPIDLGVIARIGAAHGIPSALGEASQPSLKVM